MAIPYTGKAKCGFYHNPNEKIPRAKWKSERRYACQGHRVQIEQDPNPVEDTRRMTLADHQTWGCVS